MDDAGALYASMCINEAIAKGTCVVCVLRSEEAGTAESVFCVIAASPLTATLQPEI